MAQARYAEQQVNAAAQIEARRKPYLPTFALAFAG
jgi:hypothetical protein